MPLRAPFHRRHPRLSRRNWTGLRVAPIVALSLAAAILLAGCGHAAPTAEPVVTVQAAVAQRQVLVETVSSEALLYPLRQAVLTPKVTAPVARFTVNRGDHVVQGELLAVLENRDLAAAALENRGAYQQAQANYQTATQASLPQALKKAQLDLTSAQQALAAAQRSYESAQNLFQQGALPRKDLDQAKVAFVTAQANERIAQQQYAALSNGGEQLQLEAAKGQLTVAQGRYDAAQAQLGYTDIRSPLTGVVADRPVYPGELATTSTPLMTIMEVSSVIARAHIPQAQAAHIARGDPAEIVTENGLSAPGRVTVVSPALDPNSTTVQIWVQATNPGERLRPGSTVHVTIQVGKLSNALAVPNAALLTAADGSTSVMVIGADGKAHARPVTAGTRAAGLVQIVKGLQPGERVITTGAFGLDDGTTVRVAAADSAAGDGPS